MLIDKNVLKEFTKYEPDILVGVASAKPLEHMQKLLELRASEQRITPFEEKNPRLRVEPGHLLDNCRTIITIAVPYALSQAVSLPGPGTPRGKVARCAQNIDYHRVVENKARQLVELIGSKCGKDFSHRILCDRSPLLERELAKQSGLGLIGENCTLLTCRFGSYVSLGTILLDRFIEPDRPIGRNCLHCGLCRRACPTGALKKPFILDPYRCLSYLSQASGIFPATLRSALGNMVYGCDLCQEACPLNSEVEDSKLADFAYTFFPPDPPLLSLLQLTRKEYDFTIKMTSAGWRGKTTLQRNAIIALGNCGDRDTVKILARTLENDPRPVIRVHAAWSLGRIGGKRAAFYLDKSRHNDPEGQVKKESKLALEHF